MGIHTSLPPPPNSREQPSRGTCPLSPRPLPPPGCPQDVDPAGMDAEHWAALMEEVKEDMQSSPWGSTHGFLAHTARGKAGKVTSAVGRGIQVGNPPPRNAFLSRAKSLGEGGSTITRATVDGIGRGAALSAATERKLREKRLA